MRYGILQVDNYGFWYILFPFPTIYVFVAMCCVRTMISQKDHSLSSKSVILYYRLCKFKILGAVVLNSLVIINT